jgi:antitoxin component of MazEF toxin-antitoxin module
MPIIRKLTTVGDSRGITLPKSWIENAEQEAGKKIIAIALEVDRVITISPVFEKDHIKETLKPTQKDKREEAK